MTTSFLDLVQTKMIFWLNIVSPDHKPYPSPIQSVRRNTILYSLGGVAAYNFGVRNVRTWDKLDIGTTHNDYSNDVIAQAQWLINRYKWQNLNISNSKNKNEMNNFV